MPWPLIAAGALALGGAALSANGSRQAANRQADMTLDMYNRQVDYGQLARGRLATELYGSGARNYLRSTENPADMPMFQTPGRWETQQVQIPGSPTGYSQNARGATPGGTRTENVWIPPGSRYMFSNEGDYNAYADSLGTGLFGRMENLVGESRQRGQNIVAGYDADTARLSGLSSGRLAELQGLIRGGTESLSREDASGENALQGRLSALLSGTQEWGSGREKIINEDSARALAAANSASMNELRKRGMLSGTIGADQLAGNAAEISRETNRAKQDLAEARIDRETQARGMGIQASESSRGRRLAMLADRARGLEGTTSSWLGHQTDQDYGRASARTALQQDTLGRDLDQEQWLLANRLGILTSPLMNPGVDTNAASFIPQTSGAGMGQQAFGQALGGMGGLLMGNWLGGMNQQQQQPMTQQGNPMYGPYYPGQTYR